MSDAYSVKPSEIKGLTPDARKRLSEWIARVDASTRRVECRQDALPAVQITACDGKPGRVVEAYPWIAPNDGTDAREWYDANGRKWSPGTLVYRWGDSGEAEIPDTADAAKWLRAVAGSKRAATVPVVRKPRAVAPKVGVSVPDDAIDWPAQAARLVRERDAALVDAADTRHALALATRELDTLRRVVGAAESIRAWAIATAKDVDGMVASPDYTPAESWSDRRQALARLTDA